jgi:hypothetical protein
MALVLETLSTTEAEYDPSASKNTSCLDECRGAVVLAKLGLTDAVNLETTVE